MNKYRKGRVFEYKIKSLLEKEGWIVFRCAGSKPLDLIAFHPHLKGPLSVRFIECKSNPLLFAEEFHRLKKWSEKLRVPVYVVYKVKGKLKVWKIFPNYYLAKSFREMLEE